jgi:hypothetical protein
MLWRALHRLLGWHFVHIENSCDARIRRIFWTAAGARYVKYWGERLVFIDQPGHGWTVTELTMAPPGMDLTERTRFDGLEVERRDPQRVPFGLAPMRRPVPWSG